MQTLHLTIEMQKLGRPLKHLDLILKWRSMVSYHFSLGLGTINNTTMDSFIKFSVNDQINCYSLRRWPRFVRGELLLLPDWEDRSCWSWSSGSGTWWRVRGPHRRRSWSAKTGRSESLKKTRRINWIIQISIHRKPINVVTENVINRFELSIWQRTIYTIKRNVSKESTWLPW